MIKFIKKLLNKKCKHKFDYDGGKCFHCNKTWSNIIEESNNKK